MSVDRSFDERILDTWRTGWSTGMVEGMVSAATIVQRDGDPDTARRILAEMRSRFGPNAHCDGLPDLERGLTQQGRNER